MRPEDVARLYYRLFNERNLDAACRLVDPQAEFYYVPTKQHLLGRAGYRDLAAMWLGAFEDAQLDLVALRVIDADTIEAEILGSGTHTGDLALGGSLTIPATGKHDALRFRETLHIRDGLVRKVRLEFDLADMQRRLLGKPPP